MRIKIFIIIIFILPIYSIGQINHSEYIEKCNEEFNSLLKLIPETQREKWNNEFEIITKEHLKISNEKQKDSDIYKKLHAEHIFATQYFNAINEFLLPSKTNITNSIAQEVVSITIGKSITQKIDSLTQVLDIYAKTDKAVNFEKIYNKLLLARKKNEQILIQLDTLFYTKYEFKDNIYADPYKVENYVVFDWQKQQKKFSNLKKELDDINNDIKVKQFISIKDPNPIIPLLFQFCTLIAVISGVIINFRFDKRSNTVVLILVISSLITAILLLFFSDNTIMNTAINVLIPGVGYIIFYIKNKKQSIIT